MPEQLQKIINRVLEWWKKFNTKQKALMISLTSIVIVALVILGVVMTRPTYTTLVDCDTTKEANQIKELLDGDGNIDYKVTNSTHFEVNVKDERCKHAAWLERYRNSRIRCVKSRSFLGCGWWIFTYRVG